MKRQEQGVSGKPEKKGNFWQRKGKNLVRRGASYTSAFSLLIALTGAATSEVRFGTLIPPFFSSSSSASGTGLPSSTPSHESPSAAPSYNSPSAIPIHDTPSAAPGPVFPADPCTDLTPFTSDRSQSQRALAEECITQEDRKIVIVDFYPSDKNQEKQYAALTRTLLLEDTEGLDGQDRPVVVIPASKKARTTLRKSASHNYKKNCVNGPDTADTPGAIAYETMPQLRRKYSGDFIIGLSPQNLCGTSDGYAISGTPFAAVYPADDGIGPKDGDAYVQDVASIAAHEDGHLVNLGHAGTVILRVNTVIGNSQFLGLAGSKYTEYESSADANNMMGSDYPTQDQIINPLQLDILNWPEAILEGPEHTIGLRPIKENGTTLTETDMSAGRYVYIPLKEPVDLKTGPKKTDGTVRFDSLAIIPIPGNGDYRSPQSSYVLKYILYDSQDTHNTALVNDAHLVSGTMDLDKEFFLTVDNQNFEIKATSEGITFNALENIQELIHEPSSAPLVATANNMLVGV